jgi:hypothetical protein
MACLSCSVSIEIQHIRSFNLFDNAWSRLSHSSRQIRSLLVGKAAQLVCSLPALQIFHRDSAHQAFHPFSNQNPEHPQRHLNVLSNPIPVRAFSRAAAPTQVSFFTLGRCGSRRAWRVSPTFSHWISLPRPRPLLCRYISSTT